MKRLPTKAEFDALLKLPRKWDKERKGLVFTASNGNEMFFPASGYSDGTVVDYVGDYGYYWSATPDDEIYAWSFGFYSCGASMGRINGRDYGHAVRLVSDEPCEGFINMRTGIYWATENYHDEDKKCFTWDEAMAINPTTAGTSTVEDCTPINWEQRRYEIAKSMLAAWGSYNLGAMEALNLDSNEITKNSRIAIEIADELIKQLKTTKQ